MAPAFTSVSPSRAPASFVEARIKQLLEPHIVTPRLNDRGEAEFAGRMMKEIF
jgi:hypothetical protein